MHTPSTPLNFIASSELPDPLAGLQSGRRFRPLAVAQHSYRATLWPDHIEASDTEEHARKGALPTVQVQAHDADDATQRAALVTGMRVLEVERRDDAAVAA